MMNHASTLARWRCGCVCRRGAVPSDKGLVAAGLLLAYAFATHVTRLQLLAVDLPNSVLHLAQVLALGLCVDSSGRGLVNSGARSYIGNLAHWALRGLGSMQGVLMIATSIRILVQKGLPVNDELPLLVQVIAASALCVYMGHLQQATGQEGETAQLASTTNTTADENV